MNRKSSLALSLILALLLPFQLFSQSNNLDDYYQAKVLEFNQVDPDSVLFYNQKIAASDNQVNKLLGRYAIATIAYKNGAYAETEKILNEILIETEQEPRPNSFVPSTLSSAQNYQEGIQIVKLNVYRRFFYLNRALDNMSQALKYLNARKAIVDHWPRKDNYYIRNKVSVGRDLATLNRTLKNFRENIAMLQELRDDLNEIDIDSSAPFYGTLLQDKAHFYSELAANFMFLMPEDSTLADSANIYYELAFELSKSLDKQGTEFNSQYYINKAELAFWMERWEESNWYCRKAMEYYEDKQAPSIAHYFLLMNYTNLHQPDSAIHYAPLALAAVGSSIYGRTNLYWYIARCYEMLEQFDKAYHYSKLCSDYSYQLSNDELATKNSLSQANRKKISELNQSLERKQKLAWWKTTLFVTSLVVFSVLFILILVRARRKHRTSIIAFQQQFDQINAENAVFRQEKLDAEQEVPAKGAALKETRQLSKDLKIELLKKLHKIEEKELFLNENFNAHSLAKILRTNTSYLSQIIKEEKGKPFKQYLMELRINYLVEALEVNPTYRKYSIEAMGKMIGYTNASSFTRAFKNYTQVTPSQYLKAQYKDSSI